MICCLDRVGVEFGMVPIPSICNSSMLMAIGQRKTKYLKNNKNEIEEETFLNLNTTVDHRFFDGSYGAKMNNDFKTMVETLDDKEIL